MRQPAGSGRVLGNAAYHSHGGVRQTCIAQRFGNLAGRDKFLGRGLARVGMADRLQFPTL